MGRENQIWRVETNRLVLRPWRESEVYMLEEAIAFATARTINDDVEAFRLISLAQAKNLEQKGA